MPNSTDMFANARYTDVFLDVGRFDDGPKHPAKMVTAPFRLLLIPSTNGEGKQEYVEPRGFGGDVTGVYESDTLDYETYQGRVGMGWYNGEAMVFEPHQLGDWVNDETSWLGMFSMGVI